MIWIALPIIAGILCFMLILQYINTLGLKSSKKRCPDCGGRDIKVRGLRKADKYYWSGRALYRFKKEGVCQDCGAVFGMISRSEVDAKWRMAGIRLQIGIVITLIVVVLSIAVPKLSGGDNSGDSSAEGVSGEHTVEFTVPAALADSLTQEDADAAEAERGYPITVNSDGSVTYDMTEEQYASWVANEDSYCRQLVQDLVGDEDYPNLESIEANDTFTEYTVTLSDQEITDADTKLADMLCYITGVYDASTGAELGAVNVTFATADGTAIETVEGTATLEMN